MNKLTWILLLVIILLAFSLRFYKVTENPPSLNWDEVSIGYNAYSILKTGQDEWGKTLPLHFKSYGEYKLPAQIYASIPGIAIFGLNELGVRITPVVYGTLTILLLFFLTRKVFKNNQIALISSFLLAISPWHIQLTRASFESSFAVMWIILGIWLLIKGFDNPKWWILSVIPFAISVYTYNSTRVFTPLFLLVFTFIYFKKLLKFKKILIASFLLFIVLMIPLVPFVLSGEGKARYKLVSITDDPGLIPRINEARGNSDLPEPLPRFIHNKVTYISFYFIKNYFAHFTPDFLFINGAPHKQHHVQNIGQLYLFQAPFLLFGLLILLIGDKFKLLEDKSITKNSFKWIILAWMLLVYIPVSTTNDSIPHALRTLIASPTYQIITAVGLYVFLLFLIKKKNYFILIPSLSIIVLVGLIQLFSYLNNYYNLYPNLYSRDWQYGNKQAVEYIKQSGTNYDLIVFTRHYGEPHMFTLFYLGYDPKKFIDNPKLNRFETYDWVRVLNFDKYYFPDLGDKGTRFQDIVDQNRDKKILFIGRDIDFPEEVKRLNSIKFLNNDPVFDIVEKR